MAITLDAFKEGGKLRKYVTVVGLLDKINTTYPQDQLLDQLLRSITHVGVIEDTNDNARQDSPDNIAVELISQTQSNTYIMKNTYYYEGKSESANLRYIAESLQSLWPLYFDANGTVAVTDSDVVMNWKKKGGWTIVDMYTADAPTYYTYEEYKEIEGNAEISQEDFDALSEDKKTKDSTYRKANDDIITILNNKKPDWKTTKLFSTPAQ